MNPVAVAAHIEAKPRQMDDRALWVLGRLQDSGGIPSAARSKGAPKGCMPSAKSIQNWLGEATDPKTPTEQHLAEADAYYRHRPWPETAGSTLAEC